MIDTAGSRRLKILADLDTGSVHEFYNRRWYRFKAHGMLDPYPDNYVPDACKHAPFTSAHYPYAAAVGNVFTDPWSRIRALPRDELLLPNAFSASRVRPTGLNTWDIGIGLSRSAAPETDSTKVVVVEPTNTRWAQDIAPKLRHSGPLVADERATRPSAELSFDLRASESGWDILEAAHAWAHRANAGCEIVDRPASFEGALSDELASALSAIVTAIVYDLPIRLDSKPGLFEVGGGIVVRASTRYLDPVMLVPWMMNRAPVMDRTVAVVLAAVYLDTMSREYVNRGGNYGPEAPAVDAGDRWGCSPTIVTLAGFECVDTLLHSPIALAKCCDSRERAVHYRRHVTDMLPMSDMWAHLWGAEAAGFKDGDGEWMYVPEFLRSPELSKMLSESPSLPCRHCMAFTRSTRSAPPRPESEYVYGVKLKQMPEEWQRWHKAIAHARTHITAAVSEYERQRYGRSRAKKRRLERAAEARAADTRIRRERKAKAMYERMLAGKPLRPGGLELAQEHRDKKIRENLERT